MGQTLIAHALAEQGEEEAAVRIPASVSESKAISEGVEGEL